MAEKIRMPAAAKDLRITLTIKKEILPNLLEWFNETKKPGETAEQFLLRLLVTRALQHRHGKLSVQEQKDRELARVLREEELSRELSELATDNT